MASSYSPIRSDWRTTGPSQSSPRAARSASCASSIPGRTRERSRSSTRTRNRAPAERANSQARSAVLRLPRCSGPVGLGAKRPSKFEAMVSPPLPCRAVSRKARQSLHGPLIQGQRHVSGDSKPATPQAHTGPQTKSKSRQAKAKRAESGARRAQRADEARSAVPTSGGVSRSVLATAPRLGVVNLSGRRGRRFLCRGARVRGL